MAKLRKPVSARGFTYIQSTRPENPQDGDTWYDTSTGRVLIYKGGWVYPKDPGSCWEKNPPQVTITPGTVQEITSDGGSVTFTVKVKNMDVGVCGDTTFTLTVHDSNTTDFDPSTLSQTTVTLGPHQEAEVTLTVKDKAGAASGSGVNTVYVTAEATNHPTGTSNTVSVRLAGQAYVGCTHVAPAVSISPSTQTITEDGTSASYTVTIQNQDTGPFCGATTFRLEAVDSNLVDFNHSTFDQDTVTLNPGESATVTLYVHDRVGAAVGSTSSNTTYVRVTSDVHDPAVSNSVITELAEGALTGWAKKAPTLTISPASQSISTDGGSVDYTVTIKNEDYGVNATAVTFTLAVHDSNSVDFDASTLSQTSVTLNPGEQTTVTLTVKDLLGGHGGTGQNDTYVTATAPDHPTGTSNTVTTTLEGEALTGWTKNAPSVSISPTAQEISEDGGSVNYTVTITNNDTGVDAQTVAFSLSVTDSNTTDFEPSTLSATTVNLGPGDSTTVTLTVKDRLGAATAGGENSTYVTVTAADHPTATSNTVTTRDVDAAASGWYKNAPSVSISPTSQTISVDGSSVNYTVTITNNDSGVDAQAVTFTLAVYDSNTTDFEASTLSQTSVTLNPGDSTTVTLTAKDKLGGYGGTGQNDTYVTASATDHPTGTSNTVTTTLQGEALTGWSKNAPSLSISPTSQTISVDGGSVNYTVTITNNDTGVDAQATTFTLQAVDDNTTDFQASSLSSTSVTLNPGDSTTVTLTVTDRLGGASDTQNNTYVTATATDHPTATSNTVTTTLTGEAATGWTKNAPTVTITPSSGDISEDGGTFTYTVTIKNNDTGVDAQATTFSLSVSDSNTTDFEPSTLSATSVTLNPGESATVTLTVKDKIGAASS